MSHAMNEKIVLVTGATDGSADCTELAEMGARVFVHARNQARGNQVLSELCEAAPNAVFDLIVGNLASLEEVRTMASEVLS